MQPSPLPIPSSSSANESSFPSSFCLVVAAMSAGERRIAGRVESSVERDPCRRVIARLLEAAHPLVHAGALQARRKLPVDQQVINPQAGVVLPVLAEVV